MSTATRPEQSGTAVSPTARGLWRRSRWFLLAAGFLLLVGLLVGGLGRDSQWPEQDPRSPDPDGTRAVVRLLQDQGIAVRTTADPKQLAAALAERGTTVVLPSPDLLDADELDRLSAVRRGSANRLVLIAPESAALEAFAPGVQLATRPDGSTDGAMPLATPAQCPLVEAARAGTAELGGLLYQAGAPDLACYPRHGHPALVVHSEGVDTTTVVLGDGYPLTNSRLTAEGNAALALGLLGAHPRLVWYLPDTANPGPALERKTFWDLLPGGWHWATLQLVIAAVLAALWRARRLGPVVSERLPVVVRAAETTEGRARLYRRANARGRAADSLRSAVRHRVAPILGVPVTGGEPDASALCLALAVRLDRPAADVRTLLYGAPPTDDAALLRLTDDLDALERQVRQL